ncbi:hypothetical protein E2C01_073535 [Portunus trituberculatus]|uniref:Uncharacterized protein n=1 Tax=Portunus trituberculatus TaxID=210409 RepID=A0A5B7IE71_PORTR|nr:hypothetical protein [Portunus trituberculatus]
MEEDESPVSDGMTSTMAPFYLLAEGRRRTGPPAAPPRWRRSRRRCRSPALSRPRSEAWTRCPPSCTDGGTRA